MVWQSRLTKHSVFSKGYWWHQQNWDEQINVFWWAIEHPDKYQQNIILIICSPSNLWDFPLILSFRRMLEVRMVKMTWIPKSLLRNSFNREKRFSSVQHTILTMRWRRKKKLTITSIFQRNCRLKLKFLLRTRQISREKEGNQIQPGMGPYIISKYHKKVCTNWAMMLEM